MKKILLITILSVFFSILSVLAQQINTPLACATNVFSLPNAPFMHKLVAAEGAEVAQILNLPTGLSFNSKRSLVQGTAPKQGFYNYQVVVVKNERKDTINVSLTSSPSLALPTPFMGWISWNVVQENISSNVIHRVANAFYKQGLKQAGYSYIIIDDLWHAPQRAANGMPMPDKQKFPKGIKAAIKEVHSKGLKFGIYSDAAHKTCAGAFGSYGYEEIDAKEYANWGVDLLKYDYCNAPVEQDSAFVRYKTMAEALAKTNKNIILYMCEWGERKPWLWALNAGSNAWRCTYDTRDCWVGKDGGIGVMQSIEQMKNLWPYAGVNRFNDADMMCVGIHGLGKSSSDLCSGKPGMSQREYTSQFALWCMWSSPLLLSFDLTKKLSKADKRLITNKMLIALNQDALGQQAEYLETTDSVIYFMKDLANTDVAISATNMSSKSKKIVFNLSRFSALNEHQTYKIADCVEQKQHKKIVKEKFYKTIKPHQTLVYRLSKAQ